MRLNLLKLILALVLGIAFLLLMDPHSFYGLVFHEWAGLVIVIFFLLHLVVDWKFIKVVTLRFFSKLPVKTRLNYLLDAALLVCMSLVVISGLPIAHTIDFSWLGFDTNRGNLMYWRMLHTSLSMIVLVAVGIHIGLHWKWITARFSRNR